MRRVGQVMSLGPDCDRATHPIAVVCQLPARTVLDGGQYQVIRISQRDAVEARVGRMYEGAPASQVPTRTGGRPSDRSPELHAARHAREEVVELDRLIREVP